MSGLLWGLTHTLYHITASLPSPPFTAATAAAIHRGPAAATPPAAYGAAHATLARHRVERIELDHKHTVRETVSTNHGTAAISARRAHARGSGSVGVGVGAGAGDASQIRAVSSPLPVTTYDPSGLIATENT